MSPIAFVQRHPLALVFVVIAAAVVLIGFAYRTVLTDFVKFQWWRYSDNTGFRSGYVEHRGAKLYFESHGSGSPVLLLHGGLTSQDVFFAQLPALAQEHQVIAIDLRGQGRSSMGEIPLNYSLLAEDIDAVLQNLAITQARVIGWSDGGITGLILALRYPSRVHSLFAIGANFRASGLTEETKQSIKDGLPASESLLSKALYALYSPHPKRWQRLWSELKHMWLNGPNLSRADLASIQQEIWVVVGENDNVSLAHSKEMVDALAHSRFELVADAGHNLLIQKPTIMRELMLDFASR